MGTDGRQVVERREDLALGRAGPIERLPEIVDPVPDVQARVLRLHDLDEGLDLGLAEVHHLVVDRLEQFRTTLYRQPGNHALSESAEQIRALADEEAVE